MRSRVGSPASSRATPALPSASRTAMSRRSGGTSAARLWRIAATIVVVEAAEADRQGAAEDRRQHALQVGGQQQEVDPGARLLDRL
jgi:hypothetical protein